MSIRSKTSMDMDNADESGDFQYWVRGPRWDLQIKKNKDLNLV